MNKNSIEANTYFTEKDIYDALISSKRVLTSSLILELTRDRGIFLSAEDSRDYLVEYVSSLMYDYYDLNVLIDHITPANKKEKTKTSKVSSKIDASQLKVIAKGINAKGNDNINIQISVDPQNSNKSTVTIQYDEIDFSKTSLRQKVRRESTVEFFTENDSTKIRKASNNKVDEIVHEILKGIEKNTETNIKEEKIDLKGMSFRKKTEFFTNLITGIEDYKFKDVTKVIVNNNEDDPEMEEEFINMITNASFKGSGLLQTEEYQKLKESGYYITSIVWQSDSIKKDGNRVEFEASIDHTKENEEIKFSLKGTYRYNATDKSFTKTIRPLKSDEEEAIISLLETASFSIYKKISSIDE